METEAQAKFEVSKYVLIHFTRNRHKATTASISANGVTVRPSNKAKYLGVLFDKELRFTHVQHTVKKGTKAALEWDPHQCATPGNAHMINEHEYVNTTLNHKNFNSNKNYNLALFLHVFRIICTNLISLHCVWLPSTAR